MSTPGEEPRPPMPMAYPGREPSRLRPIVAALAGLVVGAVLVGGVWAITGSGGSDPGGSGAAADAADACRIFDRLPTLTLEGIDLPMSRRVGSAGELAQAAAAGDPKYKELGEAGQKTYQALQLADPEKANEFIAQARTACDDL